MLKLLLFNYVEVVVFVVQYVEVVVFVVQYVEVVVFVVQFCWSCCPLSRFCLQFPFPVYIHALISRKKQQTSTKTSSHATNLNKNFSTRNKLFPHATKISNFVNNSTFRSDAAKI